MVFTFCIINLDDKFQISKNYMVIIKRLSKTLLLHCFSLLLFLKVIIVVVVVVIVAAEKLTYPFLTVSVCFFTVFAIKSIFLRWPSGQRSNKPLL